MSRKSLPNAYCKYIVMFLGVWFIDQILGELIMRKISTLVGAVTLAVAGAGLSNIAVAASVQGFDNQQNAPVQRMIRGDRPQGFNEIQVTSIEQLRASGYDDQYVSLVGRLVTYLGDDTYEFRDNTGSIVVELDDDHSWHHIHKDQLIQIYGKLDRDWDKLEIEVKKAHPARPIPR